LLAAFMGPSNLRISETVEEGRLRTARADSKDFIFIFVLPPGMWCRLASA